MQYQDILLPSLNIFDVDSIWQEDDKLMTRVWNLNHVVMPMYDNVLVLFQMEMQMKTTYPIVDTVRSIFEAISRFSHVIFPLGILALIFTIR